MLVEYRKDYQKIALGYLMLANNDSTFEELQIELEHFQNDDSNILLWREDSNNDFDGMVAITIDDEVIIVELIVLNPSTNQDEALASIITDLEDFYDNKTVMGTLSTTPIIEEARRLRDARN